MNFKSMAQALDGEVSRGQVVCPGPGHSRQDRSLAVRLNRGGGIVVHSFAGDDWQQCRDYVAARLGLPGFQPSRERLPRQESARQATEPPRDKNGTASGASSIWRASIDVRGTLAEAYFRGRGGIELPEGDCSRFVRFNKSCPFSQERHPALISLIRNIETDRPQAVQRTALNPDGTRIKRNGKTLRMTLGPMAGGAIKIDPDEDVTMGLHVGEGLETCLSGRMFGFRPAWALGSAGAIENFPVLAGIDALTIFGEHDRTGRNERAVKACAARWQADSREVFSAWPDSGDLNDIEAAP